MSSPGKEALVPILVLLVAGQARAGKLDDVRDEVQGGSSGSGSDDDEDEDDDDDLYVDEDGGTSWSTAGPVKGGIRISAEYAFDVGVVHRPGFAVVLDTPWLLTVDSSWTFLLEPLPGRIDHLTIGDMNACIRLASNVWVEMRTGIGARWMLDMGRIDPGFNYTLDLTVFPWRHLVLGLEGDLGTLGRAFVARGRVTLGGRLGVLELFAGYDVMVIGQVLFHGPVAGVQAWF
jgi:hypothetical protein